VYRTQLPESDITANKHSMERFGETDAGDKHALFVDGETLYGQVDRDMCAVDGTHPNDLGFLRMADGIEPVIRSMLSAAQPENA